MFWYVLSTNYDVIYTEPLASELWNSYSWSENCRMNWLHLCQRLPYITKNLWIKMSSSNLGVLVCSVKILSTNYDTIYKESIASELWNSYSWSENCRMNWLHLCQRLPYITKNLWIKMSSSNLGVLVCSVKKQNCEMHILGVRIVEWTGFTFINESGCALS